MKKFIISMLIIAVIASVILATIAALDGRPASMIISLAIAGLAGAAAIITHYEID